MNRDYENRELLRLAAKALGLYVKYEVMDHDDNLIGLKIKPHKQSGRGTAVVWNPLTDDGDAFRLAVALRFRIDSPSEKLHARAVAMSQDIEKGVFMNAGDESYDADSFVATRRAIVRAAAAIGEAMP